MAHTHPLLVLDVGSLLAFLLGQSSDQQIGWSKVGSESSPMFQFFFFFNKDEKKFFGLFILNPDGICLDAFHPSR